MSLELTIHNKQVFMICYKNFNIILTFQDLSNYKDNKMVLKSMTIMNKLYSTKSCMFNIGSQAQVCKNTYVLPV